jgi:protein phosphatase
LTIEVPELALVMLLGPAGGDRAAFAARHFSPTEVLAAPFYQGLMADGAAEAGTPEAEAADGVMRLVASTRLEGARLTVVSLPGLEPQDRQTWLDLARRHYTAAIAVVFDWAAAEGGPPLAQADWLNLEREGFAAIHTLGSPAAAKAARLIRRPLPSNRKDDIGPFDFVGDVHGCVDELRALLEQLGYVPHEAGYLHPAARRAVFVGDLVDRGPDSPGVLRIVMPMVASGAALVVVGNHDDKLLRALRGRKVKIAHGLRETLDQLRAEPPEFAAEVASFLDSLPSHYQLAGGQVVVAHAGLTERLQGREARRVRDFAMYGLTTGETDAYGLPVRLLWAKDYRGQAFVVYGHTPVPEPMRLNHTLNLDTGCAFGGRLTALRYPEHELVSVPARRQYYVPARPFLPEAAGPAAPKPGAEQG